METSIINYIVKRIETEYRLNNKNKAKEIYNSYFNQEVYQYFKEDVDKKLEEKNIILK